MGAPFADAMPGSAYVYVRSNGTWALQQALTSSDGAAGDHFGVSVALDGDTAVVGADMHDIQGDSHSGAAYVFTRTGELWTQQAELAPSDHGYGGDSFGGEVDVDADTAVVGARHRDATGSTDAGAAYVFRRTAGAWSQEARLALPDPTPLTCDEFGGAVAVDGETVVVGSDFRPVPGKYNTGAAYVYVRSGTVWSLQQQLLGSDVGNGDMFGSSVALDGDRVLVAAERHDEYMANQIGAGYLFTRWNGVWTQEAELKATDRSPGDQLGTSVALSGDVVLLGAPNQTANTLARAGTTCVFRRTPEGWAECAQLTPDSVAAQEQSGHTVALSGTTALIGSPYHAQSGAANAGVVFDCTLEAPPVTTPVLSPPLNAAGWTLSPTTVSFSASDGGSGIARIDYRQFGAPDWVEYTAPFMVSWPGVATYEFRAFANSGFYEAVKTVTVRVGWAEKPPVSTAVATPAPDASGWNKSTVTVALARTYSYTGGATLQYRPAGADQWTTYTAPFLVSAWGIHTYDYRSVDLAGVEESPHSLTVKIGAKPQISALSPTAGRRGSIVTITGKYFGAKRGTSIVTFGTKKCTNFLSWSNSRIRVRVPSRATYGAVRVKVTTFVGASNTKGFRVKR